MESKIITKKSLQEDMDKKTEKKHERTIEILAKAIARRFRAEGIKNIPKHEEL